VGGAERVIQFNERTFYSRREYLYNPMTAYKILLEYDNAQANNRWRSHTFGSKEESCAVRFDPSAGSAAGGS